jgi:hypothetical protein
MIRPVHAGLELQAAVIVDNGSTMNGNAKRSTPFRKTRPRSTFAVVRRGGRIIPATQVAITDEVLISVPIHGKVLKSSI